MLCKRIPGQSRLKQYSPVFGKNSSLSQNAPPPTHTNTGNLVSARAEEFLVTENLRGQRRGTGQKSNPVEISGLVVVTLSLRKDRH